MVMGILIAIFGLFSAISTDFLGLADAIAGELLLVLGALGMAIFVGWAMKADPAEELARGAGERFKRTIPAVIFLIRFVLPPIIAFVLFFSVINTWGAIVAFMTG